jgi:hypothetical protein
VRLTKDFFLIRLFFLFILLSACSSAPVEKKYAYKGEDLSKIGPFGVLLGHAEVPMDDFPHDRRTTIVYLENIKTKEKIQFGETQGPILMKLPPGDYVITELWAGGGCNTATGLMISTFFSELPDSVSYLRNHLEKPATQALGFKIRKGRMTDIGNILPTCFDWNTRDQFKKQFTSYIQNGKFQIFRPMNVDQYECGCKILRKLDGKAKLEMNKLIKNH